MRKVLIGSPIHQKPEVLNFFLESLVTLESTEIEISYLFIDDNNCMESKNLLRKFARENDNVSIHVSEFRDEYITNEETHFWNEKLIWKVANFKNLILKIADEFFYDYVFFIDSDLVLHPKTLIKLISSKKDIISNIFWTKWQPDFLELPQVWMYDHYEQYEKNRNEYIDNDELSRRRNEFLEKLKKPGIYEVGGLGACTLISKKAIKLGVNFSEIKNISFWGEDRHFCIRAHSLGIDLFVDTNYPAFHIYRDEDLIRLQSTNFFNQLNYNFQDLIAVIDSGFEALGSFHFEEGYSDDWRPYFTNSLVDNITETIKKSKKDTYENSTVVEAKVVRKKVVSIDIDYSKIQITIENKGFLNSIFFEEKSSFLVSLKKHEEKWIIDQFFPI